MNSRKYRFFISRMVNKGVSKKRLLASIAFRFKKNDKFLKCI